MFRNNNSRRGRRSLAPARMTGQFKKIGQTAKLVHATAPFRVGGNKQLVSIPNHNYQLKVEKLFRIFAGSVGGPITPFTTTQVLSAVRNELGVVAATTSGEMIFCHDIRVYSGMTAVPPVTPIGQAFNVIDLQLYDIENTTTNPSNAVCLFEDIASPAGIGFIHAVFPCNDRPTFNRSTPSTTFFLVGVQSASQSYVVIDMKLTYIRQTVTTN